MNKTNSTDQKYGLKLTREQSDKIMTGHGLTDPDAIRSLEINTLIDRKLGVDFPSHQRDQLIREVNRQDSKRVWHIIKGFVLLRSPWNSMVIEMVRGYSKIMTREDIVGLLDLPRPLVDKILGRRPEPKV